MCLSSLTQSKVQVRGGIDGFPMRTHPPSKASLTETWFCDELCVSMDGFDGYIVCRQDRSGVSIYVRAGLNSSIVNDLYFCDNTLEMCTVYRLNINQIIHVLISWIFTGHRMAL